MKIILEQAFHSLTRRKLLSALIIIMMVVGLFLIIGAMGYAEHNEERVDDFYSAYPEDEYRFFVTAPINSLSGDKAYTEEQVEGLRNYFRQINAAPEFKFLHFTDSVLQLYDLKVGDNCLAGYQEFNAAREYMYVESTGKYLSNVLAYSIDERVFGRFNLKIAVGTDFSDFDHTDYNAKVIPIVCGWAWHEYYKVGDILNGASHLYNGFSQDYEIVGFLEPGISILPPGATDLDTIVSLDTYVLIPYLDYIKMATPPGADKNNPAYSNLSYYEKYGKTTYIMQLEHMCEGVIFTKDVSYPIDQYIKQNGFSMLSSSKRRVMMISDSFKQSADDYFDLLLLASILILASSTLCLSLNLANKLMASFKTYAIHLISGGTVAHIKWFMIFEVLVIMFISNVGAFLCALFFGGGVFTYNEMGIFGVQVSKISLFAAACAIGVSLVVSLIALAFPLIKISVVEYDTLLRGKE
ncbi:MAG TPA: hypothetical protein PK854_05430 [Oscillospiraceae bacterium]|nr:hypothetical protein [Oscillospiraceae bacterium]HPS34690.1 hypothetical protein [Oscillospiraceae bacterium]